MLGVRCVEPDDLTISVWRNVDASENACRWRGLD
jgi:hypothetical protein